MPARRRPSASLSAKTTELALAVPQVVAHRLARMAHARAAACRRATARSSRAWSPRSTAPSANPGTPWRCRPCSRSAAFAAALALAATPPRSTRASPAAQTLAAQLQQATLAVIGKGLAPVHRRAVANAKRLARTTLR